VQLLREALEIDPQFHAARDALIIVLAGTRRAYRRATKHATVGKPRTTFSVFDYARNTESARAARSATRRGRNES
jgi:hypothetical protein